MSRLTHSLGEILTYFGRGAMSAQGTFWQERRPVLRGSSVCSATASPQVSYKATHSDFRAGYRILM